MIVFLYLFKRIRPVICFHICLLSTFLLGRLDSLDELGDSVKEVGNETDVGDLEDGCVGVLVDGDDELGLLHAGKVLDGTRDTDGNVELGGDDLAGLADLERVVGVAGVDGCTRGTNGSAEGVSKGIEDRLKVVLGLEGTATRDDLGGRAEVGARRDDNLLRDKLGVGCRVSLGLTVLHLHEASTGATSSTAAEPPWALALLKAVERTVTILTPSLAPDLTLRMALPA